LRDVELKLISELMRNSRRSDRDLAKAIKTSQPTVTRIRTKLEKEGYIKEYSMIPDFAKLGFDVMSVMFAKWEKKLTAEEYEEVIDAGRELSKNRGLSVIMVSRGIGISCDLMIISLHESYSASQEFVDSFKQFPYSDRLTLQRFLIDMTQDPTYRSLTFSSLAEYIAKSINATRKGDDPTETPLTLTHPGVKLNTLPRLSDVRRAGERRGLNENSKAKYH
jgi:DNA-binding Lrp family transcriptional regulator